jgi:hypothetical protein
VVDVVGAEAGADQLLDEVGLFVRTLRRAESGQRAAAVAITDAAEAGRGALQRLLPGGFAEVGQGIAGVGQALGVFRRGVAADQRPHQPVRVRDVVEAEAALDAEPVAVRRAVAAGNADDAVIPDLPGELASDAAVGA